MLGKILKFWEYKKMYKEGKENPGGLAKDQVKDFVYALGILPILLSAGVLVLLFVFGFTHIITSPSLIARFFFFIILIATCIFFLIIRGLAKFSGKFAENTANTVKRQLDYSNKKSKVHEVEYTVK